VSRRALLAAVSVLLAVALSMVSGVAAAESQYKKPGSYQFYPCSSCHATMKVTGMKKVVPFHHIDLTKGPHRGLFCASCHSVPDVWNLKTPWGKVEIRIPGLFNHSSLMETNKVCATCHMRTYMDYQFLAHGNKTYTCPGGKVEFIKGYKGVLYAFHICPQYKNLTTVPAKACVECHNPHNPVYRAISILPPPSERPPPPPQSPIEYGTLAVTIAGLSLLLAAAVLAHQYRD